MDAAELERVRHQFEQLARRARGESCDGAPPGVSS